MRLGRKPSCEDCFYIKKAIHGTILYCTNHLREVTKSNYCEEFKRDDKG